MSEDLRPARDPDPLAEILFEHRIVRAVLDAVDTEATRIVRGGAVRRGFWLDVVEFVDGFVDRYHHEKEEALLGALRAAGHDPARFDGLDEEHRRGRVLRHRLRTATEYGRDRDLARAAVDYVEHMRDHLDREDERLEGLRLDREETRALRELFDGLEERTCGAAGCTRYVRLARRLCRMASSNDNQAGRNAPWSW